MFRSRPTAGDLRKGHLDPNAISSAEAQKRMREEETARREAEKRRRQIMSLGRQLDHKRNEVRRLAELVRREERQVKSEENVLHREKSEDQKVALNVEKAQTELAEVEGRTNELELELQRLIEEEKRIIKVHELALVDLEKKFETNEREKLSKGKSVRARLSRLLGIKNKEVAETARAQEKVNLRKQKIETHTRDLNRFEGEVSILDNKIRALERNHNRR